MSIVEVFAGTEAEPDAQYFVLQMYFPGQNALAGHSITAYDGSGHGVALVSFPRNVANGANLATVLIATAAAQRVFGVTPDLTISPVLVPEGGAVCFDVIDCVAWGNFSAPEALTVPPGTIFNPASGLPRSMAMAMHRNLSSGGATTAFAFANPAPKNNAGQVGALPTPGINPTPTPTPPAICGGDCNGTSEVSVDEIITLVNIALGNPGDCEDGIPAGGEVDITLIIQAVSNALNGC